MDERYNVLIADSYPHESKQLKEELQKQYNVIAIAENYKSKTRFSDR